MIYCGIDQIDKELSSARKFRWGMVTNEVAQTVEGIKSRVALIKQGFNLVRLFSPEHGLLAEGADGEKQQDTTDLATGLKVTSLYGDKLAPNDNDLADLDAVFFDIPDVGCRFYTYLWTMTYLMEACARNQKLLVVLDRPNPIGALMEQAEGPFLDEATCSSFIGRWSIPVRHSCTLGELARYFAATRIPALELKIIPVSGWTRNQSALTHNWEFIPTSPAIRDASTALLYPGTGLMEGILINEGRGTERPFTCLGAPWINANELSADFNRLVLPGVQAVAINYTPNESCYKQEACGGIQLIVKDAHAFRPVFTGVALLQLLMKLYPTHMIERNYYTAANPTGEQHLDKLLGIPNAFKELKKGHLPDIEICESWHQLVSDYLLYA